MSKSKDKCREIAGSEDYREFVKAVESGEGNDARKYAGSIVRDLTDFAIEVCERITGLNLFNLTPVEKALLPFARPFNGPGRAQFGEALGNKVREYLPQLVEWYNQDRRRLPGFNSIVGEKR